MSLSLSSLLNPSPDSERRPPSSHSKDSAPPLQHVQSPTDLETGSPNSARAHSGQHSYPPTTRDEAAQALASLSASPVPPPQQWSGYATQDPNQPERRLSWERRPSGYGEHFQLPPPPPGSDTRKMSSPTLEQYHVASRSPEQRRPSGASPTQSNIVLAPMLSARGQASPEGARSHAQDPVEDVTHSHGSQPAHSEYRSSQDPSHADARGSSTLLPADADAHFNESARAHIKQETVATPQHLSSIDHHPPAELESQTSRAVSSLKNEHGLRTQSPLRDASVPLPTTETAVSDQPPAPTTKKRPAPAKTKKGTASAVRKEKPPPAKKRKMEPKRSATPSSRASKGPMIRNASGKGTPMNSSPAPSTRSYSAEPNEDQYDDDDDDMDDDPDADLYCICRRPDNGTFMIGCDGECDDWFHGKCVGIEERNKNLIDKYICPSCTEQGIGRTTFKRICRRSGCRQPAKAGKIKGGNSSMKYCSEECGLTYFREMAAMTRGREESSKNKYSRRKSSVVGAEKISAEEDLGARGGALSAGEVKALLNASNTVEEFRKLGDGVLSPPATPNGGDEDKKQDSFTEYESRALERISTNKDDARRRHALLKDRMKFVTLVKQAASRTTQERELKAKEYCGYDPRLEWTEAQFQAWRNSKAGQEAFESEMLQKRDDKDEAPPDKTENPEVCDRKKCARHHDWSKLAVDEIRFEMGDNSDRMRSLANEEADIKERAALRAKGGNMSEGTTEIHGLGITGDKERMEIDAPTEITVEPPTGSQAA